jgi:lipoprotein NlpI
MRYGKALMTVWIAAAASIAAAAGRGERELEKSIAEQDRLIAQSPRDVAAYQRRGEDYFRLGKFKESVADFDKVIELEPRREPYHWQRGISLYYAGEFERGRKQFEKHKTVNPDDVENAAWHYLCVARLEGVEKARQALIPVSGDPRVPMAQVQQMFAGTKTPDDVLAAAKAGNPKSDDLRGRLFYAHLYIGLYAEAAGKADVAREHIVLAAEKYADEDYMGEVARVHAAVLEKAGRQPRAVEPQRTRP